ncbi:hypothetical protein KGF54_003671 [Candida jiufengensis]|uniref:uncharacterized protein n=1 Tax=Candida jiufengensis TaxID=497108 RepID=UPI002223F660|nr:uncharacterized protein KGF54_003671 [Candida jiufengensis]KAI5952804.1 hypothetical protein KGF54_003671 [Candida jiufengensis]
MTLCLTRQRIGLLSRIYPTNSCSLRHNSTLFRRSLDRVPTKLYNKITEQGQSELRLQPKIQYLPLFAKSLQSFGKNVKIQTKYSLRFSQEKLKGALEPIVFHIVCVIESSNQRKSLSSYHREFFNHLLSKIEEPKQANCNELATRFKVKVNKDLELGVQCFQSISGLLKKPHTIKDLGDWIESIMSSSISKSTPLLSKTTPAFVLLDVVSRNSPFKEQYKTQFELWTHNLRILLRDRQIDDYIVKSVFENLIYFAIMYEPSDLKQLIKLTLDTKSGGSKSESKFLSDLIWKLAYFASRHQKIDYMEIANAQEVLVGRIKSSHFQLTLNGYLGIALVMSELSPAKALKLLEVAERKFLSNTNSNKDLVNYNMTKIWLAKDPEEATNNFKFAIDEFITSSKLWSIFIKKLKKCNILTESRAMLLFKKLIDSKVKVTSELISEILYPIKDYYHMEEIYHLTKNELNNECGKIFLPKYIELLQKFRNDKSLPQTIFPWDEPLQVAANGKFKGFSSVQEYLDELYHKNSNKSIQFIASYMKSINNPREVFEFYEKEIIDKNHSPNALCLGTLIKSAKKLNKFDQYTQFAIDEFIKNVKKDNYSTGITPDNLLWFNYISLLAKFNNISELSKILKWWLDINFQPKKITLMQLLYVLPQDFSYRHIKHHEIANSRNDWDWPTVEEYNNFKESKSHS